MWPVPGNCARSTSVIRLFQEAIGVVVSVIRLGSVSVALFVLIILARVLAVVDGRDPGYDQAMLMANFPLESFASYFMPLPYFEQATALGSVAELDLASRVFGNEGLARFHAIRTIAATLAVCGYVMLWRIMRRRLDLPEAVLALALVASTNEVLLFTTNPKNYVNEFFFTCLLLWVGIAYLENPKVKRAAIFLGVSFLTCAFSFVAPLIFIAVGGGVLAALIFKNRDDERISMTKRPLLVKVLGLGSTCFLISLLFHILYTVPMTALDQIAYADRYAHSFIQLAPLISSHNVEAIKGILNVFYLMVEPAYFPQALHAAGLISFLPTIHVLCALVALWGFPVYWQKSKVLAGGLAAGSVVFLLLNILHVLPITSVRHFLFFTPFAVPCFAVGLVRILRAVLTALKRGPWAPATTCALGFVLLIVAAVRSTDLENAQISSHLELVAQHPAKLWVYYGAQPGLRALRPDILNGGNVKVIGLLNHKSTTQSWQLQARDENNHLTSDDYMKRVAVWLSGSDPIWLLFTHFRPEERVPGQLSRFVEAAEADGRNCRRKDDNGGVLFFCALPGEVPEDLDALLN